MILLYCYVQIMNKKASVNITIILTIAAILIVPLSVLQLSHAQGNSDIKNTILKIHNLARSQVDVPALSWSNSLAADAQSWADHLMTLGLPPKPKLSATRAVRYEQPPRREPSLGHQRLV